MARMGASPLGALFLVVLQVLVLGKQILQTDLNPASTFFLTKGMKFKIYLPIFSLCETPLKRLLFLHESRNVF